MYTPNLQADCNGTHFSYTTVKCTYNHLVSLFGNPDSGDGDKVTAEWVLTDEFGNVFTIYDWKEYRSVKRGTIEWHIGSHGKKALEEQLAKFIEDAK